MRRTEEIIGRNVRDRRLKLGMTQAELAEAIDIGTTGVQKMEAGNHVPRIRSLEKLASVFHWHVAQLFMEDPMLYGKTPDIPPDIADAIASAAEIDIELIRRVLKLPDPDIVLQLERKSRS
jgi:transcriptional regulator with XRE-family HTH domain